MNGGGGGGDVRHLSIQSVWSALCKLCEFARIQNRTLLLKREREREREGEREKKTEREREML